MSKDLSFLKENKLFNWLLSCLALVVLGVVAMTQARQIRELQMVEVEEMNF